MYKLLIKPHSYLDILNREPYYRGFHFTRYILAEYNKRGRRTSREEVRTDSRERIKMLITTIGLKMKKFHKAPDGITTVIEYKNDS